VARPLPRRRSPAGCSKTIDEFDVMNQVRKTKTMTATPQSQPMTAPGAAQVSNLADGFISKAEVAKRLGKTARTVEQWMRRGIIPYLKIGKGRRATVLFKWTDIETHLKANFGVGNNQA
jgi:excisionase family DNA binding protein